MTEGRNNVEAKDSRCGSLAVIVDDTHAANDTGDVTRGVTTVLSRYGREIFGFLIAALSGVEAARDPHESFVDDLRRSLPGFTRNSEPRTFAYLIARRQLRRCHKCARSRKIDVVSLTSTPHPHCDPSRSAVIAVRRSLESEDRELLVLNFDRGFDWHVLAVTSLRGHATKREIDSESSNLQHRIGALRMQVKYIARRAAAHPGYQHE